MAKLSILEFPDPRLRKTASPISNVNDDHRTLIDDMFETMYAAPGIGLAATQVDIHERLLVADVSADQSEPHALINPEIPKLRFLQIFIVTTGRIHYVARGLFSPARD